MPTKTTTKHANMLIETLKIDNCNRLNKKEPRKKTEKAKTYKKIPAHWNGIRSID